MSNSYRLHDALINLLSDYLPVPCYLVRCEDPSFGHALGPVEKRTHPLYFEVEFGRVQERLRFNRAHMKRKGPQGPVLAVHAGIHDLFVPVWGAQGSIDAYILFGAFHVKLPVRAGLWREWCRLRRAPGPDDALDFQHYAQAQLETPVLDPALVKSLGQLLSAVGAALTGRGSVDIALERIAKAKREVLGRQLPWRMWHYADARRDRFNRGPFQGAELAAWDAEEFKLKRGPDSVVALVPREAVSDPVEALCRIAALQWACFEFCRERPGLVAGRISGEGALILAAATRAEVRALALEASSVLGKRLGYRLVAAYRSRPKQAADLDRSMHEAEAGLRLGLARGQDLLEAEEQAAAGELGSDLEALSQGLAEKAAQGRREEARLLRQSLGAQALRAAAGRPELLRVHLRWALLPLLSVLERRHGAFPGAGAALRGGVDQALDSASSASELLRRFESTVEDLLTRLEQPAQGELRVRLSRAAGRLRERPEEGLGLGDLAKDAGLSPAHFSRVFKRNSGLGFARARLEGRLAKARRLLAESGLSIAAVAGECGFKNAAHFSTAFKRSEGRSPLSFRNKNRK